MKTIESYLLENGGKIWAKGGNDRIYINNLNIIGLEEELITKEKLKDANLYYDIKKDKFIFTSNNDESIDSIIIEQVSIIRNEIAEANKDMTPDEIAREKNKYNFKIFKNEILIHGGDIAITSEDDLFEVIEELKALDEAGKCDGAKDMLHRINNFPRPVFSRIKKGITVIFHFYHHEILDGKLGVGYNSHPTNEELKLAKRVN